jgi:2-dehydropantoate 2-reductase
VIAWLADYTAQSAKTHSGIWRDLAVRKRKTEIDAQIGVIAELAREKGIPTPALDRLVGLIHDVEDGRRPQSLDTFNELLKACSSDLTPAP